MPQVRVFVESLADEGLARLLLDSLPCIIDNGWDESGATSAAATAMFMHPERPVAVMYGTRSDDPKRMREFRRFLHSEIGQNYYENYFVALAEQRLLDWVLTDPKLRQAYDESPQDMKIYADRANRVVALAKKVGFDNSILLEQNADYRGLLDFIHQHAAAGSAA